MKEIKGTVEDMSRVFLSMLWIITLASEEPGKNTQNEETIMIMKEEHQKGDKRSMKKVIHRQMRTVSRKVLELFLTLLVLSILVFFMSRLAPGDPLVSFYSDGFERMSTTEMEESRGRLGLDEPMSVQYRIWGEKHSLLLGGVEFLLIFLLALPFGAFCALKGRRGGPMTGIRVITGSVPVFFISLILILIFSVFLRVLLPAAPQTREV